MHVISVVTDPRYPSHEPINKEGMVLRSAPDLKQPIDTTTNVDIDKPLNMSLNKLNTVLLSEIYKNVSKSLKFLRKNWKLATSEIIENFTIYTDKDNYQKAMYFQLSVSLIRGKICLKICSCILSSKSNMVVNGKGNIIAFDFMSEDLETLAVQYIFKSVFKKPLYEHTFKYLKIRPITNSDIVYCNYPRRGRTWHVRMMNSNAIIQKFYST